jgi:hypothetical protein
VYWVVAQSLSSARARCPNMVFVDPASLQLIYGPLRDFVRNQHGNLVGTLKHLAVLEARFQRRYLREEEMDWTCDFDTNTEFFDRVTTMSPRDLAGFLTENDIEAFSLLRPQNIIHGDSYLQHVHRQWDRRCQVVQESIAAESYLSARLADLAQASISIYCCSQNTNALIRNYALDGTSTACALYSRLYEKPASMNPNCHASSSSSIPIGTMQSTEKHMERRRVFHFYLLISGSSKHINNKRYWKCDPLEGTLFDENSLTHQRNTQPLLDTGNGSHNRYSKKLEGESLSPLARL